MDLLRAKLGNNVGKTGNSSKKLTETSNEEKNTYKKTAKTQVEISKAIMTAKRTNRNNFGS